MGKEVEFFYISHSKICVEGSCSLVDQLQLDVSQVFLMMW